VERFVLPNQYCLSRLAFLKYPAHYAKYY